MRGRSGFILLGLMVLLGGLSACQRPGARVWAETISESARAEILAELPKEAAEALIPLSEIFYSRITSRRFNSRATFQDPSVRQFFPTIAAYSDYYAALVDALDLGQHSIQSADGRQTARHRHGHQWLVATLFAIRRSQRSPVALLEFGPPAYG